MIGLWALRTSVARGKEWVLCNTYTYKEEAEKWLEVWQKDEPTIKFVLSQKKPKLKENIMIRLKEGQKVLDEQGNIYLIDENYILVEKYSSRDVLKILSKEGLSSKTIDSILSILATTLDIQEIEEKLRKYMKL